MLKFGTPTIAPPLAIKKCTLQTGCTVYVPLVLCPPENVFCHDCPEQGCFIQGDCTDPLLSSYNIIPSSFCLSMHNTLV